MSRGNRLDKRGASLFDSTLAARPRHKLPGNLLAAARSLLRQLAGQSTGALVRALRHLARLGQLTPRPGRAATGIEQHVDLMSSPRPRQRQTRTGACCVLGIWSLLSVKFCR